MITNDAKKRLVSIITKLISTHAEDENALGDIYDIVCRYLGIVNKAEKTSASKFSGGNKETQRKIIAVDFDGVIGSWVDGSYSGDSTVLSNPPVKGAIEWLSSLLNDERFFVTIYSSRSKILGFEDALRKWLKDNGMGQEDINKLSVSATKPFAFIFIDDRSWRFNGKFPSALDLLSFKAWYEE